MEITPPPSVKRPSGLLRAHGRGKPVKIWQFMKVPSARLGEHWMFEQLRVPIKGRGDGFSWKSRDLEHSGQLARDGWVEAELLAVRLTGGCERHGFGCRTMPQMDRASAAGAIQNS